MYLSKHYAAPWVCPDRFRKNFKVSYNRCVIISPVKGEIHAFGMLALAYTAVPCGKAVRYIFKQA
jgi:hypothetical protein